MAKFICLQAGHEGRLTGATGAPGEQELNVRVRNRLAQILIQKGFMVQLVNADPTQVELNKDFDLFLALHGDANIYNTGGGVCASGDASVDAMWRESARIRDCVIAEYFKNSEIVNHPERSNINMTKYYMWLKLSAKTPCVIIEMGVVQDAHDKVLLSDTERISSALARGICKAFGVTYDVVLPPPPQIDPHVAEIEGLKTQLNAANKALFDQDNLHKNELALLQIECDKKMASYKNDIKAGIIKLISEY